MSDPNRREFLKRVSAGIAASAVLKSGASAADLLAPMEQRASLPDVPTTESLRSVVMTHRFGDLFNPPGLTNQWGCAQAGVDVTAIRSIAFPPFAQGEMNVAPLGAGGELMTGVLYVDGEYFASTKTPIEFVWHPDRIMRRSIYKNLELSSVTIIPCGTMTTGVKLTVRNTGNTRRKTEIKLAVN